MRKHSWRFLVILATLACGAPALAQPKWGDAALGSRSYDDFERPRACAGCHREFFPQWQMSMMSQAYTHEWDEIEYFELAVPHAEREPKVAGVKAGCNGCHTPIAFLAGDVPPPKPQKRSRANESVSCDVCHTISGRAEGTPFNFSYISSPGRTKYGPREGVESPHHNTKKLELIRQPEFCGTCHNEQSPYGMWVKATQIEYAEGPYPKMGLRCHDCHMPVAAGRVASMSSEDLPLHQHLFFGAHVTAKIRGAIELRLIPDRLEATPGEKLKLTLYAFNAKAGHKIPTGSVEDRELWVHVEAVDAKGNRYHLPVDRKGFPGEDTTIGSNQPAWFDLGVAQGKADFAGIPRDGVPEGSRIYRMAYLNPKGEMTIMQWYTASFGPDYRIGPLETKTDSYTFKIPGKAPLGPLAVKATLYYRLLVKPVGEYLKVPAEEYEDRVMSEAEARIELVD